jgi:hypothetical protein
MVSSYVCFALTSYVVVKVPFITPHYPQLNQILDTDFRALHIYLFLSLVIKLVNAVIIDWYIATQKIGKYGIWALWGRFSANLEHFVFCIIIMTHIAQDIFVPGLDMKFIPSPFNSTNATRL